MRFALPIVLVLACSGSQAPTEAHRRAPAFSLPDQTGAERSLSDMEGKIVILYFYPRDATPGCTVEACAFRDAWGRLEDAGAQVLGVSTDDVESHAAFADEHGLPFPLLADVDAEVASSYGVTMRGNMTMRTTFLIDQSGVIRRVWEQVDPAVHVDEVLAAIAEL
ncbi:MAG: peroxiredoxin [Myxococcota bacterium]